jgi:hypothetical protein
MKNLGKIISDKDIITKEYLDSKGYISAINSKMVTDALGFTPFDSAAFTKASIKNALGIADWALAASKPSYNFSEVRNKPTSLSGYGITDALSTAGGTINGNLVLNGNLRGKPISNPINAEVINAWRFVYANDTIYIQAGTGDGKKEGNISFSGYLGSTANNIDFNANSITFIGATSIWNTLEVTGKIVGSAGISIAGTNGSYLSYVDNVFNVEASLNVGPGRNLFLNNQSIGKWADVANYIPLPYLDKDTYLMPTNAFDNSGHLEASYAANALYAADKRFTVSGSGFSNFNASQLFNGSYEDDYCGKVAVGTTATLTISNNGNDIIQGYPYGDIYLSFYYTSVPASVTLEVYCNHAYQGIGWKTLTLKGKRGQHNNIWYYNNSYYAITQIRITITASTSAVASLSEIDWHLNRASLSNLPIITKFGIDQTLYGHMKFANNVTFESAVGHNVKFDGFALNVNAGLYIGNGYWLRLYGQPITKWSDLGTYITPISSETTSEKTISPNTFYKWGSVSALSITLGEATNNTHINNYMFEFTASTGFALGGLSGVKWADGVKPNIKAGYTYQFSIINNCATYSAFKTA